MSATEERTVSTPRLADAAREAEKEQLNQRVRSLRLPQTTTASGGNRAVWALCAMLACSTVVLGYRQFAKAPAPVQTESQPVVSDAAADAASGELALESKGYIIPVHQILVSPKVSGMIVKLNITESQRVKKGDVLAEIEDTEYRAERDRAKALLESAKQNLAELERGFRPEEIDQAKAELAESEALLAQRAADYKRSVELLAKKALSREQFDSVVSGYQAMDRNVQRLRLGLKLVEEGPRIERVNAGRAQVRQAEAELAKAEWRLSNCVIRAPISGTILKKSAEEGSLVNPVAMQGFYSLCEMADLADLEVDLTIQERDISRIHKDQKCKVRTEAFPDRVYEGHVSRLMPTADRSKGAIPVRVKVTVPSDEEGVYLKPEMGAIVSFLNK